MRIVTGIQPTGTLHLGNYLGAIRPLVNMQNAAGYDTKIFVFIADLHTLSSPMSAHSRREGVISMASALLACGVNMDRVILFRQSDVPAHLTLQYLLNGIATMGPLERMVQYKDKVAMLGKDSEGPRLALFTYPVLQAADILLYRATHVPVGEDQKQHLELARQLATRFNRTYAKDNPVFVQPQAVTDLHGARIMSLQDGTRKMSKSNPSDLSRITLTDDTDEIARKIRKAKTDTQELPYTIEGLINRPEAMNLLNIHASLKKQLVLKSIAEFAGHGFKDLKEALIEALVEELDPIRKEYADFLHHPDAVKNVLREGAGEASAEAQSVIDRALETMGFG